MSESHTSASTPEKKKPSWLLRVAVAVAATVALLMVVGALFAYRWLGDPKRQAALAALRAAATRPGAAEIRALGCDHAMIQTKADLENLVDAMIGKQMAGDSPAEVLVICRLEPGTPYEPGCSEVAAAYGSAADDVPARFFVQVHRQTLPGSNTLCEGTYNATGALAK